MFSNAEMDSMSTVLEKHLWRSDLVGYAAARNKRILDAEIVEYLQKKDSLIIKYGTEEIDAEGNPTGNVSLKFDSPAFPDFVKELDSYATLEAEPALLKLKYTDVAGILTGSEILEIDWMLED